MRFLPLGDRVVINRRTLVGAVDFGGGLQYLVVIEKNSQDPSFIVEEKNPQFGQCIIIGEVGSDLTSFIDLRIP